jgi:transcriptional regulator with XRE-family HTH domain
MSRISEKIKSARMQQNKTIKQLAKLCGVAETYISEIESGKKVINDIMIRKMSTVLNINLNEPLFQEE